MDKALFCVDSPLQALCAIEAIDKFKPKEYDFLLVENGVRTIQIENLLKSENIRYEIVKSRYSIWEQFGFIYDSFLPRRSNYDSIFFGHYLAIGILFSLIPLLKNQGQIIYVDDGNYIIPLSRNTTTIPLLTKIRRFILSIVCSIRKIHDDNFFTIYAENIDNKNWNIIKNELNRIMSTCTIHDDGIVYVIGTVPDVYCNYLGISLNVFIQKLGSFLSTIKNDNPGTKIIYIPHGRDNNENIKQLCRQLDISYQKNDCCIELYAYNRPRPQFIYGFSSTALFTLQKMMPGTKVVNIQLDGKNRAAMKEYDEINSFFKKNGISTINL